MSCSLCLLTVKGRCNGLVRVRKQRGVGREQQYSRGLTAAGPFCCGPGGVRFKNAEKTLTFPNRPTGVRLSRVSELDFFNRDFCQLDFCQLDFLNWKKGGNPEMSSNPSIFQQSTYIVELSFFPVWRGVIAQLDFFPPELEKIAQPTGLFDCDGETHNYRFLATTKVFDRFDRMQY